MKLFDNPIKFIDDLFDLNLKMANVSFQRLGQLVFFNAGSALAMFRICRKNSLFFHYNVRSWFMNVNYLHKFPSDLAIRFGCKH